MQDILHYDFNKAMISANNQELLTSDVLSYKRILIVDDSVTTRTMVKNILLNIGYMVDTVLDADEALVKLKLTHYDLIITDLTMPKIDGYEFIERLRNDEMYADIPIIVISSLPENQARKRLNKLSIAHYISKDNFDQADLAMQVKEILTKFHH